MYAYRFRIYFTPLPGFFSPFPHGTGSLSVDHEYLALEDGPPIFRQDFTCPALLVVHLVLPRCFRLRGYHPLWPDFPDRLTRCALGNSIVAPQNHLELPRHRLCNTCGLSHITGLGSSLFARRYWGSRCFFPFLQVLRCISSLRYPRRAMDSHVALEGLLRVVSESQKSPDQRLLAAPRGLSQLNHVFRRLLVPRHPHVHPL